MRIVIQRVLRASVTIDNQMVSSIDKGLMILVGVREGDTEPDMQWLAAKAANMRIFDDENGVMNRSVMDVDGEILAVSQPLVYPRRRARIGCAALRRVLCRIAENHR